MRLENPVADVKVDVQAEKVQKLFLDFLQNFKLTPTSDNYASYAGIEAAAKKLIIKYYHKQVEDLKSNDKKTLYVDFGHLAACDPTFELRESVLTDFYRYVQCGLTGSRFEPYLRKAVHAFVSECDPEQGKENKDFYLAFHNLPSIDK